MPITSIEALGLAEAVGAQYEDRSSTGAQKIIEALEAASFPHTQGLRTLFFQNGTKEKVLSQLQLMVFRDEQKALRK